MLWNYQWDYPLAGNIPFTCCHQAALSFDQVFLAAHEYTLTMHVASDANTDEEGMGIRATGVVKSVPEPSSLLLLASGIISLAARRRRPRV